MKTSTACRRLALGALWLGSLFAAALHAESADEQLWDSIRHGDLTSLQEAIADGAEVREARSALLASALTGRDLALVPPLLEAGADVERGSLEGARPLLVAISRREVPTELIRRLIDAGARIDTDDPAGGVILHALRAGRDDLALWLLEHGAPLNRADAAERTELMELAARDQINVDAGAELMQKLLAAGADVRARDKEGKNAADIAAEQGDVELLAILEPGNPEARDLATLRQTGLDRRLATALRAHAGSKIRWASPPPFDQPGPQQNVIRALLTAGANPNGKVPVWNNMKRPATSVFNLALIREGFARDWCGDAEVLRDMLEAGARWDSLNENLGHALTLLAAHADCLAVALAAGLPAAESFSVSSGNDGPAPHHGRTTLLHAAARGDSAESVALLIGHGAGLETPDDQGFTPLLAAVQAGREASYQRLLDAGANIDAKTVDGRGRAELAAEAGHAAWVREWTPENSWPDWARQYPPTSRSRFLGEWRRGEPRHALALNLRDDGMGDGFPGPIFAWREIEGGIAIRQATAHPKLRAHRQVAELRLLDDGAGYLVQKTEAGMPPPSVAGGFIWRRPDAPPYDENAAAEKLVAKQADADAATSLQKIRTGAGDSLYLSGLGRKTLPAERRWRQASVNWGRLRVWPTTADWPKLTRLELANQDALEIETGALRLPKLANLEIRRARLRTLPWAPADTPELQELKLHDNRLARLPDGWRAAPKLTSLIISGNRLRALPEDLGEAPALVMLSAGGNQLSDLPLSLAQTPLTSLALDDNRFTRVPRVISDLHRLEHLSLDNNRLVEIGDVASHLTDLQTLELGRNQLTAVPDLRGATRLKRLSLRANRLTSLPDDLAWLPASVGELDLGGNALTHIPPALIERGFARLSLRGNALPDEEARALEQEAEAAWRDGRKRTGP